MFLRVGNVPAISEIVGFLKRGTGNRELINELSPGHGQIKEETIKNWGMETVSDIGLSDKEDTRRGAVIEFMKIRQ